MRIRTMLAAAAAPAALAAVLLGTAGQASAAVAAPQAALTASVVQQQKGVYAVTHESGVSDTTSLPGYNPGDPDWVAAHPTIVDSPGGPVWAYDDVERQLTATPNGDGSWEVSLRTVGTYHAFANPLNGTPWNGSGRINSVSTWHVDSGTPSKANLGGQTDPSMRSQNIVAQFFGVDGSKVHGANPGSYWDYYGIPGAADLGVPGLMHQT